MKIGIVSDTHDDVPYFASIAALFAKQSPELIIHCGDWVAPYSVVEFGRAIDAVLPGMTIRGVFGNNDGDQFRILEAIRDEKLNIDIAKDILEIPAEREGDRPVAIYHGTEEKIVNALTGYGEYRAVFRGHTHIPKVLMHETRYGKVLEVNPGTASSYSRGRVTKRGSVAIYDSEANSAELLFFDR
ncbi:MAG: metallophosphoesterase family protein [Patescibacteria group bacterium]|nr:metallophosphoesterase family protein [Patescibacteria group bacterium]